MSQVKLKKRILTFTLSMLNAGAITRRCRAHASPVSPTSPSPMSCLASGLLPPAPALSKAPVESVIAALTSSGSESTSRGRGPNQYTNGRPYRAGQTLYCGVARATTPSWRKEARGLDRAAASRAR